MITWKTSTCNYDEKQMPWSKYGVILDNFHPNKNNELIDWCKTQLNGKYQLTPADSFYDILGMVSIFVETDEDLVLVKLRW